MTSLNHVAVHVAQPSYKAVSLQCKDINEDHVATGHAELHSWYRACPIVDHATCIYVLVTCTALSPFCFNVTQLMWQCTGLAHLQ